MPSKNAVLSAIEDALIDAFNNQVELFSNTLVVSTEGVAGTVLQKSIFTFCFVFYCLNIFFCFLFFENEFKKKKFVHKPCKGKC